MTFHFGFSCGMLRKHIVKGKQKNLALLNKGIILQESGVRSQESGVRIQELERSFFRALKRENNRSELHPYLGISYRVSATPKTFSFFSS